MKVDEIRQKTSINQLLKEKETERSINRSLVYEGYHQYLGPVRKMAWFPVNSFHFFSATYIFLEKDT